MIDLREMNKAVKIKLIKRYFVEQNVIWRHTMKTLLKVQNLELFLRSNFIIPKTTQFYTEVLTYIKDFKQTNLSPEIIYNQYLWYNENLRIDNEPIYYHYFKEMEFFRLEI